MVHVKARRREEIGRGTHSWGNKNKPPLILLIAQKYVLFIIHREWTRINANEQLFFIRHPYTCHGFAAARRPSARTNQYDL
jgi:hypothetical protein